MQFEFATATKIIFGPGTLNSIGEIAAGLGQSVLIISGGPHQILDRLLDQLGRSALSTNFIKTSGEPTVEIIQHAVEYALTLSPGLVIGIGGGSAIDTAKATAALVTNPGQVSDYLEVIGLNKPLTHPPMPFIAIPTTAGTGSEVTKNAVIGASARHIKVSMRSQFLLPRVALIDPELTLSVPPEITAYTGMDALTQLIEPFTCNVPNPLTDAICIEGLRHIKQSFSKVFDDGNNLQAREDMSLASLFSGLAMANAKLGAVHGLAGPIGGEISAHHGAICARLLPEVMTANVNALKSQSPEDGVLARYKLIGELLSGDSDASPDTAIEWIKSICRHMRIQPLSTLGLAEEQFPRIIEKAKIASSMKGNPVTLSGQDLRNILEKSLSNL